MTLDGTMDELHRKLDQLLACSSGRTCPMCGICSHHSQQLSAQTKLLEALEKKVTEVRAALDELAHGLDERAGEKRSVPLSALQRRKSFPVRSSGEEVYLHLDRLRVQRAAQEKGQTAVLLKDAKGEGSRGEVQTDRVSAKQVTKGSSRAAAWLAGAESKQKPPSKIRVALTEPAEIREHEKGAGGELGTNAASSKMKVQPEIFIPPPEKMEKVVNPPEKVTAPPKDVPTLAASKGPPAATQNQATVKISDVPFPVKATVFPPNTATLPTSSQKTSSSPPALTSSSSHPPKFLVTKFTPPPPPPPTLHLQKQSLGSPEAPSQSTDSSSPPTPSGAETPAPNHLKVPGPPWNLNKPTTNPQTAKPSAGSSVLKQVYTCPDSLQSLQGTGGRAECPPAPAPSELEPGPAATRAKSSRSQTARGFQIGISTGPAADRSSSQTRTCIKIIDDAPPQPAPFPHRCVSLKSSPAYDFSVRTQDLLGGGRFGKVHRCTDNKSGLGLAAKVISARSSKEKEAAMNEIQVMNQLNHVSILQLFDAFQSRNQVVLILECVEGGELFERIVDESSPLTEVDAMVFVKQICEGVQYMHQMYVLHLDLKPENILCVNRSSHQIKIIDFGLARRYKPREKLRVSFGTPEFLAPEVVNFDFVSFPTDMWTLGVVAYMLLSGLSPFLGDDDSETLNNVLTVSWYFDEETFEHVSAEAKDFISNLLIRERSGRLSAAQCLKHPWLNHISEKARSSNIVLKSQLLLRKYMARRLWKRNYTAVAAANRFKKIGSSGSLTSLGV